MMMLGKMRRLSTTTIDLGKGTFVGHRIDAPKATASTSKEELLEYYKLMYTMRRMEIKCDTEYKARNSAEFQFRCSATYFLTVCVVRSRSCDHSCRGEKFFNFFIYFLIFWFSDCFFFQLTTYFLNSPQQPH